MKNKRRKNKGREFEKRVQKTLNSGSLWFDKGDLKTKNHVIECKYTEKKGFRITIRLLRKLWDEALEANKLPALTIGIKDGKDLWMLKIKVEKEVC